MDLFFHISELLVFSFWLFSPYSIIIFHYSVNTHLNTFRHGVKKVKFCLADGSDITSYEWKRLNNGACIINNVTCKNLSERTHCYCGGDRPVGEAL